MDELLEALIKLPSSRSARWSLIAKTIARWYRPLRPEDALSVERLRQAEARLGRSLPAALVEWYAQSGGAADVWCKVNRWLPPESLRMNAEGELVIWTENQVTAEWSIADLKVDDPPVIVRTDRHRTDFDSESLSGFAIACTLENAKLWAPPMRCSASVKSSNEIPALVASRYRKCDLPPRAWPVLPTTFYAGTDILLELQGTDWLFATAWSESSARDFEDAIWPLVRKSTEGYWNRFTGTEHM